MGGQWGCRAPINGLVNIYSKWVFTSAYRPAYLIEQIFVNPIGITVWWLDEVLELGHHTRKGNESWNGRWAHCCDKQSINPGFMKRCSNDLVFQKNWWEWNCCLSETTSGSSSTLKGYDGYEVDMDHLVGSTKTGWLPSWERENISPFFRRHFWVNEFSGFLVWWDTVDGRNPAPPGMYKSL